MLELVFVLEVDECVTVMVEVELETVWVELVVVSEVDVELKLEEVLVVLCSRSS